eukprot:gene7355-503_t
MSNCSFVSSSEFVVEANQQQSGPESEVASESHPDPDRWVAVVDARAVAQQCSHTVSVHVAPRTTWLSTQVVRSKLITEVVVDLHSKHRNFTAPESKLRCESNQV